MELKLKLRFAGIVLALFLIMIVFDWYKNIDYMAIYDEKNEEYLPSGEHYKITSYKLDNNKDYKWVQINTIRKTKSGMPFIFDRETIKSSKRELLLVPNQ